MHYMIWISFAVIGLAAAIGGGTTLAKAIIELKKSWQAKRAEKGAK